MKLFSLSKAINVPHITLKYTEGFYHCWENIMQKIEIAEPIDTTRLISDPFLVEVPIFVSDTQAREEIIAETKPGEDANASRK